MLDRRALLAAAWASVQASAAMAAGFHVKPVVIALPYPVGGRSGSVARALAEKLSVR